jgi:hypothetical protein
MLCIGLISAFLYHFKLEKATPDLYYDHEEMASTSGSSIPSLFSCPDVPPQAVAIRVNAFSRPWFTRPYSHLPFPQARLSDPWWNVTNGKDPYPCKEG